MDLVPTIIAAGILGGSAYFFLHNHSSIPGTSPETGGRNFNSVCDWIGRLFGAMILGVAAAFTIPVFLHATSSDLIRQIVVVPDRKGLEDAVGEDPSLTGNREGDRSQWYVFCGFCVIAGYGAQRFLPAMLDQILKQLEEQKARVKKAEEKAETANDTAKTAKDIAERVVDDISEPDAEETLRALESSENSEPLGENETRIMHAFHRARRENNWIRRSKEGLSQDTGISVDAIEEPLNRLVEGGLVDKRSGRGRNGWLLSPKGIKWQPKAEPLQKGLDPVKNPQGGTG